MKKFITIALAVAVLFSFAACQEPIDVNGYVPTGLSIQYNGEDILAGEAFDATQYSATITYKNGKPGEYAGQFALMDNQSPAQATDTYATGVYVTASVQGEAAPIDAVYTPTVYAVEKVVADVSGATVKEVAVGSASVGLDGVTVTAYYDNGKTKDVTALATATVKDGTTSAAKDKEVEFAQVLGTTVTVEGEWKVNVVDAKAYDASKFNDIEIVVEYYDATATTEKQEKAWIGDTAKLVVKAVDTNGNKSDSLSYGTTVGTNYTANVDVSAGVKVTDENQTITVTLVQDGIIKQKSTTIAAGSPYVVSLNDTTPVALIDPAKVYDGGTSLSVSDLKITYKMAGADAETDSTKEAFPGSIMVLENIPENTSSTNTQKTVNLLISYGKDNKTVVAETVDVMVKGTTGA